MGQQPNGRGSRWAWHSVIPCTCCAWWVSAGAGRVGTGNTEQNTLLSRATPSGCLVTTSCASLCPHASKAEARGPQFQTNLPYGRTTPCKSESRSGTRRQQITASHAARLPDPELVVLGQKSRLAKRSGMRSMAAGLPTTPRPSSLQAQDRSNISF